MMFGVCSVLLGVGFILGWYIAFQSRAKAERVMLCSNQETFENAVRCICGHVIKSRGIDYCAIGGCDRERGDKGFIKAERR